MKTMRKFSLQLKPSNSQNFNTINVNRTLAYLRREISEFILSRKSEEEYYSVDVLFEKRSIKKDDAKLILNKIMEELSEIKWKCALAYGDTGLYIYSTDEMPKICNLGELIE